MPLRTDTSLDVDDPRDPTTIRTRGPYLRGDPDPTVLTTQLLHREISSLREIIEARLMGMDKALVLLQSAVDRVPSIAELNARFEERFNSISVQFKERDARVEQSARESKVAVDAAFSAQKEAVSEQNKSSTAAIAKSEAATTKQIDAMGLLINASQKATDEKIDDMKARITVIESRGAGMASGFGYIATGIGIVAAIIGAIVALFFKTSGAG